MKDEEGTLEEIPELTPVEMKMLEAEIFHVDGWTSLAGHNALHRLERLGYVSTFIGGDSQYTAINAKRTEKGTAVLIKIKGGL